MSNESLKQPMMQPDRESSVESTNANQRIAQLPEETCKLSDEQAKAIALLRSQLELSDAQLKALSFRNAERIVRIIGFET